MKFSKKTLLGVSVVVAVISMIVFASRETAAPLNTTIVKKGNVVQEVSVTGRVKPANTVNMGFEKSGRVAAVYARVGEQVPAGRLLAEVESSSANGTLMEAEARLAELKRGSRPEEIAIKKAELAKYEQDLDNAYSGISDILNDAFTKADDSLHTKTTGIFSGFRSTSYKYTFLICDTQLTVNGENLRSAAENDFDIWRAENTLSFASTTRAELANTLSVASRHVEIVFSLLETISRALSLDCTATNSALDGYRTNINTARTNITTVLSNINTKQQSIAALALTVAKIKNELSLLESGSASEVIAAQEARVLIARSDLAKYSIVAPISGIVTKVDIKSGENASIGNTVISIISSTSFEIEAFVPEADIAKINRGNSAKITLDAYGEEVLFAGRVTMIDPAETIIDNVPTYKTSLHFLSNDSRIKSGMTANIDIGTSSRENVLYLPERAIITRNNGKFVRTILADGTTTDSPVTVGLKGSNGEIEILSGVTEGTTVAIVPKE